MYCLTLSNANLALHKMLPPQQTTDDDELRKAVGDKNQELVQQTTLKSRHEHLITKVKILSQHRLDLVHQANVAAKQLEQQCSRGTLTHTAEQAG